jgi:hypothetical protein
LNSRSPNSARSRASRAEIAGCDRPSRRAAAVTTRSAIRDREMADDWGKRGFTTGAVLDGDGGARMARAA